MESPLNAPSVVELLRRQIALSYPLATYAAVAKAHGIPVSTFAAWLADESATGFRRIGLASAHDVLTKLKAHHSVHARMEELWIAEAKATHAAKKETA
jgi:hypothetical protein